MTRTHYLRRKVGDQDSRETPLYLSYDLSMCVKAV